jgi:hypothetical protein
LRLSFPEKADFFPPVSFLFLFLSAFYINFHAWDTVACNGVFLTSN